MSEFIYKQKRASLKNPPEVKVCPECKCKTVQVLIDESEYCTRERCLYRKKPTG